MAILITAEVPGQTRQSYDGMLEVLGDPIKRTPGFLIHGAYETEDGGWRVFEVWETKDQANQFFARHIAPNLPPGVRPKRKVHELHSCVQP